MLPSRGFFKEELCPLYEIQQCERPHCHFRHKKIDISNVDEIFNSFEEAIADLPFIRLPPKKEQTLNEDQALNNVKDKVLEVTNSRPTPKDRLVDFHSSSDKNNSTSNVVEYYPKPIKVPRLSQDEINQLQVAHIAPTVSKEIVSIQIDSKEPAEHSGINTNNENKTIISSNTHEEKNETNVVQEKRDHRLSDSEKRGIDTIVKLLKEDPSRIEFVANLLKSLAKSDLGKSERRSSSTSHSSRKSSRRSSHSSSRSSRSSRKSSRKRSRSRSRESRRKRRRESDSENRDKSAKHSSSSKSKSDNGKNTKSKEEDVVVQEKKSSSEDENDVDSDDGNKEDEISADEDEKFAAIPDLTDGEDDDDVTLEEQMGRLHDSSNAVGSVNSKRRVAHETACPADHNMLRNKVGVKKAFVRPADRQKQQPPPQPTSTEAPRPVPLHPLLGAPKARIMAVPNAQRMLAAKVTLQKTIVTPESSVSGTISRTVKPGSFRQEHKPADDDILRPVAPAGSLTVPQAIRQATVLRLYAELKYLPSKNEQREASLRLEDQIFQSHKDSFKKYQMSTVSAIMKARRGLPKESSSYKKESEFFNSSRELILTNEELTANGYPMYLEEGYASCFFSEEFRYNKKYRHIRDAMERGKRYCVRCAKTYDVDPQTGEQTPVPDSCLFHSDRSMRRWRGEAPTHKCCNSSVGCQSESIHVTDTKDYQRLPNCVRTSSKSNPEKYHKVLALDCEMVYTRLGIELAQITVVDSDCNIVYETLVKPYEVVEDYNTQFSGISEAKLKLAKKTLKDVQRDLLEIISEETVVVGHSLDSDFRAMHFIHESVCDTSFIYRKESDAQGSYYKMRLKDLSAYHLGKIIQEGLDGHSAAEDAIAAMKLLLHKVYPHLRKDCTHCS